MFVAALRIPPSPEALKQAASVTGLAPADVSRLLAGTLPRVLVRATEEGDRLVQALEQIGFLAFTGETAAIASEQDRVVVRSLEWIPGGLVALDGRSQRHECPAEAIWLFQRGVRRIETSEVVKTTERRLDVTKAVITGGLMFTKKVETTSVKTDLTKEAFLLVQRRDGLPDLIFHERRVNYACLGQGIQPSTYGNLVALLARLRALAPTAPLDDRVSRPGFVTGLPLMAADPVDLSLHLVAQAHLRGC